MTSTSHTAAASTLSEERQLGTLGLAYRRSVMSLQSVFGGKSNSQAREQSEREPLLNNNNDEPARAGPSYGSVLDLPPARRVPKPKTVKSPVRVEAKVWFANERTWMSWLRVSLLIGSFALAMYNSAGFYSTREGVAANINGPASPNQSTIRTFAIIYALISVLTLSWGLFNYHRRLYLIRTKFAGDFSDLIGPPVICLVLFVAVLVNFVIRVKEHNFNNIN